MNLRDMFHAANNDITPSEQLISDTLLKMAATEAAPQKKRGYMRYVRVAAVAACCVVIAVAAVALRPEQPKLPVDAPPAQTTTITPQESDVSSDDEAVTTTATSADGTESSTGVTTVTEGNIETQTGTVDTTIESGTTAPLITTQQSGGADSGIVTTTATSATAQSMVNSDVTSATTQMSSASATSFTTTTSVYTTTVHSTSASTSYTTAVTSHTTTSYFTTTTTTENTELETTYTTTTTISYTTTYMTTTTTAMTTTGSEEVSGTYITTTAISELPCDYVTIGAVLAPIYEMDYLDGPTETVPDSGDLTFAEAEDWYGIDFYTSLGGLSCNQSSVSSGECVLTYGDMSNYNDTSRAGISFAVSSNWYPPPSSVSFDLYEFVQIGNVEVALGIYNPNSTSGAQQLCATIYDPNAGTYVHLYAKGITIDAFSEILTEIIY